MSQADTNRWTVWARRNDAHLVSRLFESFGGYRWTDHGAPGGVTSCKATGVAATNWVNGADYYERAFCVGEDAHLWQREVRNRVPQPWVDNGPAPAAMTLSGRITVTAYVNGSSHWTVYVFATTNQNHLVCWREDTVTHAKQWLDPDNLNVYSSTAQLASSRAPGPTPAYFRVFAARTNGNVRIRRLNQAGWRVLDVTAPVGVSMFATAAAAEDWIDGSTYRIFLFCTSTTQSNKLWALQAITPDPTSSTDYSWVSRTLQTGLGNFANSGYAIAATTRGDGATRAIEGFALSTLGSTPPERIYRTKFISGSGGLSSLWDIGVDGETAKRKGGLAAYDGGSLSHICFIGSGSNGNATHLYTKYGSESSGSDPWNWANHQSGSPWVALPSDGLPHAETSAAFFDGKGIVGAIVRPREGGDTDFAYVQTLWSSTDGHSWNNWQTVNPTVGGITYQIQSDPTVDFDDDGAAYVTVLAGNYFGGLCTDRNWLVDAVVYYVKTWDGSAFNPPVLVAEADSLDHPWMEIYRDPNGPDRVHFIWADEVTNMIRYTSMVNGVLDDPHDLGPGGVPILSVGAGGTVYAHWGYEVCRIAEGTWDRCRRDPPQELPDALKPINGQYIDIPGTEKNIRTMISTIMASPSDPDVVYYAFHKRESGGAPPYYHDVFFSTGRYDPGTDWITWDETPTPLTDVTDDDADQFQPGIAVALDNNQGRDMVFVSWYDRHGTSCAPDWTNRCYRVNRSVSYDEGDHFFYTQGVPIDSSDSLSDPDLLERHCRARGIRFVGDYHAVRGDRFHARHIVVGAPLGSAPPAGYLASGWVSGGYHYWQ